MNWRGLPEVFDLGMGRRGSTLKKTNEVSGQCPVGVGERQSAAACFTFAHPAAGNLPRTFSASNGPGAAMRLRAASTWPQVFHNSTPRTRPASR